MSNKHRTKAALLAHKKQLLEEIQYSQKSINDLQTKLENKRYDDEPGSSDSEDFFPDAIEKGPDYQKLKFQHSMLKTCQHAAQELTGLTVLQSEVNVLVEDPQFEGELPICEPGTWREVTAECRIDLIPFTITFLTHTGLNIFAPTSYRALKTSLVKSSHEVELNNSVLQGMRSPSDAVEVIRSYAAAYRSRRTTLAHLANKYANSLFMEPHPEGGFVLKCANLLEILWRLENKWSPLVPFHHRMKFDLEYMDESYVKIITQAHKELLDPSIQSDERTLLLAKIITTCLEARGAIDSESDLESVGIMSRKTENQKETAPQDKDREVMAPPKKLPKKTKTVVSKEISKTKNALKRGIEDDTEENAKKLKSTEVGTGNKNAKTKDKIGDLKNNDKESNSTENNVKNNDVVKKKPNEKTDVKKTQINNVKTNSKSKQKDTIEQMVNNIDSNKTNDENAKKRKHDDNIRTETVDNQKQIKNAKAKTIVENNESGVKAAKPAKDASKNVKKTKEDKTQKIANGIDKNPTNKYTNNIELSNNNDIENNDNNNRLNNVTKKGKMTVVNDKNSVKTKPHDISRIRIDKNAKKTIMDDINVRKENNQNDFPSNAIDKKAKTSTVNDKNAVKEKNKKDPLAKKIDKKNKMAIANDKKFDVITKKLTDIQNKNKNPKNVDEFKNIDKNIANDNNERTGKNKDIEKIVVNNTKIQHESRTKSNEIIENKITGKTVPRTKSNEIVKNKTDNTDVQTVKRGIEENVKTTNKQSVASTNKATNKFVNKKIISNKAEMLTKNSEINKKILKINTKSVRDSIHKSPLLKNPLKLQNSQKAGNIKTQNKGSIKIFSGNTEKENSGKNTKIPQKKISSSNENNFKNNMLRISPRNLSSKFKTVNMSKELMKKMVKNTNIPRLMKKPVPRSSK